MARHDGARSLKRFAKADTADMDVAYRHILAWAKRIILNPDPEMPTQLRGRQADNWRQLLAVADACGGAWGALVREAAIVFSKSFQEEDVIVVLLRHIRETFECAWG